MKILYLFDKDGRFIEICFQIGKAEYSSTITNIERIIEEKAFIAFDLTLTCISCKEFKTNMIIVSKELYAEELSKRL